MLIWNGWHNLSLLLAVLIGYIGIKPTTCKAGGDLHAIQCVDAFIGNYKSVKSYDTVMHKREWSQDGQLVHDEVVQLQFEKPNRVVFKYIGEGNTGIRNNGMTVTYQNGERVSVQLGETHGLGFLVKGIASLVIGSELSLFDSKVLEDELFTINRAGFDYLAKALTFHLSSLKLSEKGGITSLTEKGCHLKYKPHLEGDSSENLKPEESIFPLEEKYGTLAYAIFLQNRFQLKTFQDLFVRKKDITLKIAHSFLPFELTLDELSQMPSQFILYRGEQVAGSYDFENTRITKF